MQLKMIKQRVVKVRGNKIYFNDPPKFHDNELVINDKSNFGYKICKVNNKSIELLIIPQSEDVLLFDIIKGDVLYNFAPFTGEKE